MVFICTRWYFVNLMVLGGAQNSGPRMSLLYNDDFIFKFINTFIYTYIHIVSTHVSKLVLGYWSYLYVSVDVKDSCCLLPSTNDSTFSLTEDLSLRPGIRYILSQDIVSMKSTIFCEFLAFMQTWLCEPYNSTKTYLSRNECVMGSF